MTAQPLNTTRDKTIYVDFRNAPKADAQDIPYSEEAERATIGAALINPNIFPELLEVLRPEMFFFLRHSYIWRALERLEQRGEPVDNLTVCNELKDVGYLEQIGGPAYITELITNTPTSVHAEIYAQIVYRAHVRRQLMKTSDAIKAIAMDTEKNIEQVCIEIEAKAHAATQLGIRDTEQTIAEAAQLVADKIEYRMQNKDTGFLPTGFIDLDNQIIGLERGKYHVVMARTGIGKTLWTLTMALNMARLGIRVFFASNELSIESLTYRLVAMESGINSKTVRTGQMDERQYSLVMEAFSRISKLPIVMDYIKRMTILDIAGKYHRINNRQGVDVVFVDGIYKMHEPGYRENRVLELEAISERFTELAAEYNVPFAVTQQAKPEVDNRQDKRPTKGDSRWCDKIVQDCDVLFGLYREGHYDPNCDDPTAFEVNVLKGRDNETGTTYLKFMSEIPKFVNATRRSVDLGE